MAVHDFWKPYYRFHGRHALCNAHLLRDLTGLYEVTWEAWVDKLRSLLAAMLDATNQARAADHSHVDAGRMASYPAHFDAFAPDDLGIHVWSMPLTRSADVIDTLTQSLDAEVTRKTTALLKGLQDAKKAGKTPTTGQQAKLVQQLRELDARVPHYAGLFGEQLDNLTMQLDLARQSVRRALVE